MGHPERGGNSQIEVLAKQYEQLVAQYQAAEKSGDQETMAKLAPQIQKLQKQLQ